jgi:hypothetical protein
MLQKERNREILKRSLLKRKKWIIIEDREILKRTLGKEKGRGNYPSSGCLEDRIIKGGRANYWSLGDFDNNNSKRDLLRPRPQESQVKNCPPKEST